MLKKQVLNCDCVEGLYCSGRVSWLSPAAGQFSCLPPHRVVVVLLRLPGATARLASICPATVALIVKVRHGERLVISEMVAALRTGNHQSSRVWETT